MPIQSPSPQTASADVVRGTLDLLILKALSLEAMHGWAITQRLEEKGWIESEWRATEQNRRARYYELTTAGRRALGDETESWQRYVAMVDVILRTS